MNIRYDGSFEGLLTVIYDTWTDFSSVEDILRPGPGTFFEEKYIETDRVKGEKVYRFLKEKYPSFTRSFFRYGYLTERRRFDYFGVLALHGIYQRGRDFLYSSLPEMVEYREGVKKLKRELHTYLGLVRFRETEGGALYAPIRPEGNLLLPLGGHFMRRLPREVFLIHDVGRNQGALYENGKLDLVEFQGNPPEYSGEEGEFSQLWRIFTQAVSVEERRSKKRQAANMPKKYWEFLTETEIK